MKNFWVILLLLSGCATTQKQTIEPMPKIEGWVQLDKALPKPAEVELALYSLIDGKPMKVAVQRFSVHLLPLAYSFTLPPVSYAEGSLYLQARLRWSGETSIQAEYQSQIQPSKPVTNKAIALSIRQCFPHCR